MRTIINLFVKNFQPDPSKTVWLVCNYVATTHVVSFFFNIVFFHCKAFASFVLQTTCASIIEVQIALSTTSWLMWSVSRRQRIGGHAGESSNVETANSHRGPRLASIRGGRRWYSHEWWSVQHGPSRTGTASWRRCTPVIPRTFA